jgi:hypothetical protein
MPADEVAGLEHAQLVALVVELFARIEALATDHERLVAENARLRSDAAKNSGNSSKPVCHER